MGYPPFFAAYAVSHKTARVKRIRLRLLMVPALGFSKKAYTSQNSSSIRAHPKRQLGCAPLAKQANLSRSVLSGNKERPGQFAPAFPCLLQ